MKTKLYLLIISVIVANNIQAQSFGRALLEGLARGVENAAQIQRQQLQQLQQQNSNNASSVYQQSKSALNNSSFSLQNTYATNVNKTINFSDGRVFKGIIHDDSYIGDLYYADGTHCKGTFDYN